MSVYNYHLDMQVFISVHIKGILHGGEKIWVLCSSDENNIS